MKFAQALMLVFCMAFTLPIATLIKPQPTKINGFNATIYTTADSTNYRITNMGTIVLKDFGQPKETEPCIFIDPNKQFQKFIGIGGAITDASAEVFAALPKNKQQEVMDAYYDSVKGIGYTLARTNINSCDFSSDMYTYIKEGDASLKTFDIEHDQKYKLPFIKAATAKAGKLTLFVSPWSPPAFMKSNNNMLHGGTLKNEFSQSWANYYVKFIKAYQKNNIPIWGLTVQNEPMAVQTWESCNYTGEQERDFIKLYLGPTLAKAGLGNIKIIAWDHNRDLMYQRASTVLNDAIAAKYVWGIGFHWYEDWTGGGKIFDNVKRVAEAYPDKNLIFTEGCTERFDNKQFKLWRMGEAYGRSMINDFNNGTTAWTDWNVLLDNNGGPNHVGNFCFAPMHANLQTNEITYLSSYYYIGQFSKFIRPGARRIISSSSRGQLLTTAFKNTDGKIVVIVMNQSNDKLSYRLWMKNKAAETVSLPHSISTVVIE
jgi:glucosylceramidase